MTGKKRKLTGKQQFFVAEYQKDWNATRAALSAGYTKKNPSEMGYLLLQIPLVKEAIQRGIHERLRRVGVHSERILTEIARVGFSDTRLLFREDGSLKPPSEWDDATAASVSGMDVSEIKGKGREQVGEMKRVKMYDKVKALELLSKHLGIIGDKSHDDKDDDIERVLTTLELSAKLVYLVKLAAERKQIEMKNVVDVE